MNKIFDMNCALQDLAKTKEIEASELCAMATMIDRVDDQIKNLLEKELIPVDQADEIKNKALAKAQVVFDKYSEKKVIETNFSTGDPIAFFFGVDWNRNTIDKPLIDVINKDKALNEVRAFVEERRKLYKLNPIEETFIQIFGKKESDFKREERYLVFKISDMGKVLTEQDVENISRCNAAIISSRTFRDLPIRNYVVVQDNWPEFETVWDLIEKRVTGWGIY